MLKIENLEIKYGENKIFQNFNLEIEEQQMLGVLASSGSGKTTLINAMIGLKKFNGNVTIDNQKVPNKKIYDIIGVMPQETALYEQISGLDNYLFFMKLAKLNLPKNEINEVFKKYGLLDSKDKKVFHYSGGMKRKLSLIIGLMKKPKYLFLDEPTVGIDPLQKEEFWNYFKELREAGSTLIITTHVMEEAGRCDKLLFLRKGEILAYDSINKIKEKSLSGDLNQVFIDLINQGGKNGS